jgi:hypothetical protein
MRRAGDRAMSRKTQFPGDVTRININDGREVRYWCAQLKCTSGQLRAAVKLVGPLVADVRAVLPKRD